MVKRILGYNFFSCLPLLEIAIQIWFIRKHSDILIRMREVGFSPFESEKSDDPVVLGRQYAKMCYFWAINPISDAFLGQGRVEEKLKFVWYT